MKKTLLAAGLVTSMAAGSLPLHAQQSGPAFEQEFEQVRAELAGAVYEGEDAPSKGTGMLVSGIVLGGVGALFCAMGGIFTAVEEKPEESPLVFVGFIGGGVALATGIPLLIAGIVQRGNYNEWYSEQQQNVGVLDHVRVQPLPGGGAVGYEATF